MVRTVCLSSCTAALEMALHLLGVGPDDEVIVPAYTYTATASTVLHVGARLVMVDSNVAVLNHKDENHCSSMSFAFVRLLGKTREETNAVIEMHTCLSDEDVAHVIEIFVDILS